MAIIALESFDHYAGLQDMKQAPFNVANTQGFSGFSTGRLGGSSLEINSIFTSADDDGRLVRFFSPSSNSIVVGMGLLFTPNGDDPSGFTLSRSGSDQLQVYLDPSTHRLVISRSGTVLGTSTSRFLWDRWYYMELRATIGSQGSFELRVDNVTVLSASSVNTQAQGDDQVDAIRFGATTFNSDGSLYVDDLYIIDQNQGGQTGFLGDVKVADLVADSDSAVTWSPNPSGGANYENVDDGAVLDNASYNESSTSGEQDVYGLTNLSSVPRNIYAVQPVGLFCKADAGPRKVKIGTEDADGSTQQLSGELNLSTEWVYKDQIFETDADSNAWTNQTVNEAKFVVETA